MIGDACILLTCNFLLVIIQVAIVVGGHNFFFGNSWVTTTGLNRSTVYQISESQSSWADSRNIDNNATFEHISFKELTSRGVTAMDMMALTFCEENGIPVVVFNLLQPGNILKALCVD
ncbi:hypothetical protein PTKIN_Ptkin06aG0050800 [Pterospermum kingtungense]